MAQTIRINVGRQSEALKPIESKSSKSSDSSIDAVFKYLFSQIYMNFYPLEKNRKIRTEV